MEEAQDDTDLEELLAVAEAGVADVLEAYEFAERYYFAAVAGSVTAPPMTYGSNTSAAR